MTTAPRRGLIQGIGAVCREFWDCSDNLECCPVSKICKLECEEQEVYKCRK